VKERKTERKENTRFFSINMLRTVRTKNFCLCIYQAFAAMVTNKQLPSPIPSLGPVSSVSYL
jgi:hypothetical protein